MSQEKKLIKNSSIYAFGNISRQLVGFLMLPVYTRFLTPADYGVVGLLVFMVSLIELLFGGHMVHAVSKFYYDADNEAAKKRILSTALLITTAISSITVLVLFLSSGPTSVLLFDSSDYATLIALFSVLILTHALENYALVYIRIQQRPWLFISVSMAKLAMQLSLNVLLVAIWEMGVLGVALSSMISSLIFSIAMTCYTLFHVGIGFSKEAAKKLFRFSWPLWIGGIAGLYIGSSNRYFIKHFSTLEDVGYFELASKFASVTLLLVWTPFAQYWQVERFNIYKQPNPIPVYQSAFKIICTLLSISALGIALFSETAIRIMAAEEFHSAANAVPILAIGSIFYCLVLFNNFSFLVKEKTAWMSRNSYLTATIITALNILLIPSWGFIGASIAMAATNLVWFLIVFYFGKKSYDMELPLGIVVYGIFIITLSIVLAEFSPKDKLVIDILVRAAIFSVGLFFISLPLARESGIRKKVEVYIKNRRGKP